MIKQTNKREKSQISCAELIITAQLSMGCAFWPPFKEESVYRGGKKRANFTVEKPDKHPGGQGQHQKW